MKELIERLRNYENCTDDDIDRAANVIERLYAAVEDTVDTLESMDLHIDNPLYDRLRRLLEGNGE